MAGRMLGVPAREILFKIAPGRYSSDARQTRGERIFPFK